jgi:serine/threonine protein kinase
MPLTDLIGQTLDEKYRIERELGRGGMGTVYLATHVGTERPVAVKVIAPQFMERQEFVERFRREARAAGRLRHPNVVDVTDFGFADAPQGTVAYLTMEYLDGCTLGEILEEEKNLPVGWTLDILEQVCSAVHEAHKQGIIHRDLKPDNIWLEPNQRGGYTVKVLDFGIAKLEANTGLILSGAEEVDISIAPNTRETIADISRNSTLHDTASPTFISESATAMIKVRPDDIAVASEKTTAVVQPVVENGQDDVGTKLISEGGGSSVPVTLRSTVLDSSSTGDLTRVGAVLGTPNYMSPEQCRGEKLDARSDVYSLGVIAYQMLSGQTPFSGDFTQVMEAHKSAPVPPFKVKKVRKKLRRTIFSALAKEPEDRPQSAEAFATILRSRSEGISGLLRRAGMIYTEHITKFIGLSAIFMAPMMVLTTILVAVGLLEATQQISGTTRMLISAPFGILQFFATSLGAYLVIGTATWIVTQYFAVPLRPIRLRTALKASKGKWKRFLGTGLLTTLSQLTIGLGVSVVAGLILGLLAWLIFGVNTVALVVAAVLGLVIGFCVFLMSGVMTALVGPVVMMENLKGFAAIKRSIGLVRRSLVTSMAAVFIMFLIPAMIAGIISTAVNLSVKGFSSQVHKTEAQDEGEGATVQLDTGEGENEIGFSVGTNRGARIIDVDDDTRKRVRNAISEMLMQVFLLPVQVLITSFTAIIVALLYLKTRQAAGEPLQELLSNFEETDQPRKKWQERVRQRLLQSGRVTSKPTG